uniref:G-protein coupled receptors family 1 profile domain-containing protein n=1 Tax=Stegastes partitus TaxID=144197 RepID=A0A3B5AF87_9TELE
ILYMAVSQVSYQLSVCKVTMLCPVCGFLTVLTILIGGISHSAGDVRGEIHGCVSSASVWAVSSILQVKDLCSNIAVMLGSVSREYDEAFTCVVFVSAGVAITSSYIGVAAAARSASADKTSARKARNTLLLHLVQLGLSLSSTIYNPLLIALSRTVTRIVIARFNISGAVTMFTFLLPRCLSALVYGLRDQTVTFMCCVFPNRYFSGFKSKKFILLFVMSLLMVANSSSVVATST